MKVTLESLPGSSDWTMTVHSSRKPVRCSTEAENSAERPPPWFMARWWHGDMATLIITQPLQKWPSIINSPVRWLLLPRPPFKYPFAKLFVTAGREARYLDQSGVWCLLSPHSTCLHHHAHCYGYCQWDNKSLIGNVHQANHSHESGNKISKTSLEF